MTHTGGESATSGFREQMSGQLRAARVLTGLLQRGDREGLPVLEWTISHNGAQVTGRSYAQPGSARRAALAAWAAALGITLGEEYHQDSRMTTITGTAQRERTGTGPRRSRSPATSGRTDPPARGDQAVTAGSATVSGPVRTVPSPPPETMTGRPCRAGGQAHPCWAQRCRPGLSRTRTDHYHAHRRRESGGPFPGHPSLRHADPGPGLFPGQGARAGELA